MSGNSRNGDPRIIIAEAKEVLESSGYLLEGRTAEAFENTHFVVERSLFYSDPREPSRSIEIDVRSTSFEPLVDSVAGAYVSNVSVQPFVECKNNSQPIAFIIRPERFPHYNEKHIKYGGFPLSSANPTTGIHEAIPTLLHMRDWHHYCGVREVATQFCGFKLIEGKGKVPKGKEPPLHWKMETADDMRHYRQSFSDLCVAIECERTVTGLLSHKTLELHFYYPIVVFQGPIYEVRVRGPEVDIVETDHLQFRHSTSVHKRAVHAQIDVISEKALPKLITLILAEGARAAATIKAGLYDRLLASAVEQKQVASRRGQVPPIDIGGLMFG